MGDAGGVSSWENDDSKKNKGRGESRGKVSQTAGRKQPRARPFRRSENKKGGKEDGKKARWCSRRLAKILTEATRKKKIARATLSNTKLVDH